MTTRVVLKAEFVAMLVHTDDSQVPALDALSDGASERLVIAGIHRGEHHVVKSGQVVSVYAGGCVQPTLHVVGHHKSALVVFLPTVDVKVLRRELYVQSAPSSRAKVDQTSTVRHLGPFGHRPLLLVRWQDGRTSRLVSIIDQEGQHPVSYRAAVAWARQLLFKTHPPRDADPTNDAMAMVTAETSWLEGATQRVGNGCESRLTLDEPAVTCVVQVQPHSDRWTIKLEGRLGGTAPQSCSLWPQQGFSGHIKGMFDQKFGNDDVDQTFLIRGHAGAVQGMVTADELMLRSGDSLTVSVHGDHFSAELQPTPANAGAALSFVLGWWRRVARRTASID